MDLTALEAAVLDLLLAGDDPWLGVLREQRRLLRVVDREHTGVGFFTSFDMHADAPRLDGRPSLRFGDVHADIDGLPHGAGFVLVVDDGLMTMLEGYCYDEAWSPKADAPFALRYERQPRGRPF